MTIASLVWADLTRVCSARSWRMVGSAMLAITVLSVVALGDLDLDPLNPAWSQVGSVAGSAAPFMLGMAAFDAAGALRDGVDHPVPGRSWRRRLIWSRVLAVSVVAVIAWIVCATTAIVLGDRLVDGYTLDLVWTGASVEVIVGAALSTLTMGVLGTAVGVVTRRPGVAVATALGWFAIVETTLASVADSLARWLPGQASAALLEHQLVRSDSAVVAVFALLFWAAAGALGATWRFVQAELR